MTKAAQSPGVAFGEQVRRVRLAKGWSSQGLLAEALEGVGYFINRSTLTRLENGTRTPSLDEAFAVAVALEVSPLALVLPFEATGSVAVAPDVAVPVEQARAWARGDEPLPGQDVRFFESHSPEFWVDVNTLRRQAILRTLVEELAEADQAEDSGRRARILDSIENELRRQRERED